MTETEPAAPTPEEVFRDYAPRIFHLARRMLGNDADAEDVTQEVLLTVVRKLDTFRGDAALPTWLHRVTVNAALNRRRKRSNVQAHEHELPDTVANYDAEGCHRRPPRTWGGPPEDCVLERERKELLEAAIARLPPMYRDVLVLADLEELPNAEIAEMLDMSLAAVKSRLHRARMFLRDELAPHFEEAGT